MSVVRTYQILTPFELKARAPGGMRASKAIASAHDRLAELADSILPSLDEGLDQLRHMLTGRDRPSADVLEKAHGLADRLMGFCAVVSVAHLDKALLKLCQLIDAIHCSGHWSDGAFNPCLAVVRRARAGQVSEKEMVAVCEELDLCRERFLHVARSGFDVAH